MKIKATPGTRKRSKRAATLPKPTQRQASSSSAPPPANTNAAGSDDDNEDLADIFKRRNASMFHIPTSNWEAAVTGVDQLMVQYGLQFEAHPSSPLGSRSLSKGTLVTYESSLRAIRWFCTMIGDYESLLIIQPHKVLPACPSMHVRTLGALIVMKCGIAGEPVVLPGDVEPFRDIDGEIMLCDGTWGDWLSSNRFLSCISTIHQARGNAGGYEERCQSCYDLPAETRYLGCHMHPGKPQVYRKGNPRQSEFLKDCIKHAQKTTASHEVHGDSPLLPSDLKNIRRRLIGTNQIEDLQLWAMMCVGFKLALRADEIVSLEINDSNHGLNWDQSVLDTDGKQVINLCFRIQGKRDCRPINLKLHPDDKCPELCAVRALLIYLHVARIRTGYLFPTSSELDRLMHLRDGGECTDAISYQTFMQRFKSVCTEVVPRSDKWGTHCLRKTYYLLGTWAKATDTDLMKGARHSSIEQVLIYKSDASSLYNDALQLSLLVDNDVPDWKPIYYDHLNISRALRIESGGSPLSKDLLEVADHYVAVILRLPATVDRSIAQIIDASVRASRPLQTLELLQQELGEVAKLNPLLRERLIKLLEAYISERNFIPLELRPPHMCIQCQSNALNPGSFSNPSNPSNPPPSNSEPPAAHSTAPASSTTSPPDSGTPPSPATWHQKQSRHPSSQSDGAWSSAAINHAPGRPSAPAPAPSAALIGLNPPLPQSFVVQPLRPPASTTRIARGVDGIEIEGRLNVKEFKGVDKVHALMDCYQRGIAIVATSDKKSRGVFTNGARSFMQQTDHIKACLEGHFGGNAELFVARHGEDFPMTNFKKICNGSGTLCNI